MADKWAVANGNWSAGATWNDGTVPAAGDTVYANGKIVTVDAGLTTPVVALLTNAANAGLGVVAGMYFNPGSGCTIQADQITAGGTHCVQANNSVSYTVIASTVTGGSMAAVGGVCHNSSGTCTAVVGQAVGGAYNSQSATGFFVTSGTLLFTGDCVGSSSNNQAPGVYITNGTGHSITGTATGGAGGAPGVTNASGTQVYVSTAKSNAFPSSGSAGAFGTAQVYSAGSILIDAMIFGAGGWPPVSGPHFVRDAGTNFVQMRQSSGGAITVMGEVSSDYPSPNNVRSGVSYNFGASVGTCAVPPAGSVALGVPVDATVGTAALSPEALLGTALKTRLENCATVQTTGDQLAALM